MYGILIKKVLFALEIFLEIFLNYQRKQKNPFSKHKFLKKLGFQREFIKTKKEGNYVSIFIQ